MAGATSTKPYLLRAVYEWCMDNGYTPYITVVVDPQTRVPMEYVRNGEIVLNIGSVAATRLQMGNEVIECTVRFSGAAKELVIPVAAVAAIHARENGQGLTFEPESAETGREADAAEPGASGDTREPPKPGGKPTLKRVK